MSYIDTLSTFSIDSIPDLDIVVLGALELLGDASMPQIDIDYSHPLVVGSGNAEATGRILFQDRDAVFASESDFVEKLENIDSIDGVVLISASGAKHAPIIAKKAREMGKHATLITNTPDSPASTVVDNEYVLPKNREPYTYNTSTYMGMILGKTHEDPSAIQDFILNNTANITFPDLSEFKKFYIIVPPQFSGSIRMLNVKFIELFGREIARDIETSEYVRHATTVVPSNELFISFGEENTSWGKPENRLHIPLPDNAGYGAMTAIGYYIVGQIQRAHPDWFKQNIEQYCKEVSEIFGTTINPIVDN